MKKILAILLSLTLLLGCTSALAETVLGEPFAADLEILKSAFSSYYTAVCKGECAWQDADGAVIATGEKIRDAVFHLNDAGKVTHITCSFVGPLEEMTNTTPLSNCVVLAPLSMFLAETLDFDALSVRLETLTGTEMEEVMGCLLHMVDATPEQMAEGLSSSGTLMGYPAQMSYYLDFSDESEIICHLELVIGPMGTTF